MAFAFLSAAIATIAVHTVSRNINTSEWEVGATSAAGSELRSGGIKAWFVTISALIIAFGSQLRDTGRWFFLHARRQWGRYLILIALIILVELWQQTMPQLKEWSDTSWVFIFGSPVGIEVRDASFKGLNGIRVAWNGFAPIMAGLRQIAGIIQASLRVSLTTCSQLEPVSIIITLGEALVSIGLFLINVIPSFVNVFITLSRSTPHNVPGLDFVPALDGILDFVQSARPILPCTCAPGPIGDGNERFFDMLDERNISLLLNSTFNLPIAVVWEAGRFFGLPGILFWCGTDLGDPEVRNCRRQLPPEFSVMGNLLARMSVELFAWFEGLADAFLGFGRDDFFLLPDVKAPVPLAALGEYGASLIWTGVTGANMIYHYALFPPPALYVGHQDFSPIVNHMRNGAHKFATTYRLFVQDLQDRNFGIFTPIEQEAIHHIVNGTEDVLLIPAGFTSALLNLIKGAGLLDPAVGIAAANADLDNVRALTDSANAHFAAAASVVFPGAVEVTQEVLHVIDPVIDSITTIIRNYSGNALAWARDGGIGRLLDEMDEHLPAFAAGIANLLRDWGKFDGTLFATTPDTSFIRRLVPFDEFLLLCQVRPDPLHNATWNDARVLAFLDEPSIRCAVSNFIEALIHMMIRPAQILGRAADVIFNVNRDGATFLCGPVEALSVFRDFRAVIYALLGPLNALLKLLPAFSSCTVEIKDVEIFIVEDWIGLPFKGLKFVASLVARRCPIVPGITGDLATCEGLIITGYNIFIGSTFDGLLAMRELTECILPGSSSTDYAVTLQENFGINGTVSNKLCVLVDRLGDLLDDLIRLFTDLPGLIRDKIIFILTKIKEVITCFVQNIILIFNAFAVGIRCIFIHGVRLDQIITCVRIEWETITFLIIHGFTNCFTVLDEIDGIPSPTVTALRSDDFFIAMHPLPNRYAYDDWIGASPAGYPLLLEDEITEQETCNNAGEFVTHWTAGWYTNTTFTLPPNRVVVLTDAYVGSGSVLACYRGAVDPSDNITCLLTLNLIKARDAFFWGCTCNTSGASNCSTDNDCFVNTTNGYFCDFRIPGCQAVDINTQPQLVPDYKGLDFINISCSAGSPPAGWFGPSNATASTPTWRGMRFAARLNNPPSFPGSSPYVPFLPPMDVVGVLGVQGILLDGSIVGPDFPNGTVAVEALCPFSYAVAGIERHHEEFRRWPSNNREFALSRTVSVLCRYFDEPFPTATAETSVTESATMETMITTAASETSTATATAGAKRALMARKRLSPQTATSTTTSISTTSTERFERCNRILSLFENATEPSLRAVLEENYENCLMKTVVSLAGTTFVDGVVNIFQWYNGSANATLTNSSGAVYGAVWLRESLANLSAFAGDEIARPYYDYVSVRAAWTSFLEALVPGANTGATTATATSSSDDVAPTEYQAKRGGYKRLRHRRVLYKRLGPTSTTTASASVSATETATSLVTVTATAPDVLPTGAAPTPQLEDLFRIIPRVQEADYCLQLRTSPSEPWDQFVDNDTLCIDCPIIVHIVTDTTTVIQRIIEYYQNQFDSSPDFYRKPDYRALFDRPIFTAEEFEHIPDPPFDADFNVSRLGWPILLVEELFEFVSRWFVVDRVERVLAARHPFLPVESPTFIGQVRRVLNLFERLVATDPGRCQHRILRFTCTEQTFKEWGGFPRLLRAMTSIFSFEDSPRTLLYWVRQGLFCNWVDAASIRYGRGALGLIPGFALSIAIFVTIGAIASYFLPQAVMKYFALVTLILIFFFGLAFAFSTSPACWTVSVVIIPTPLPIPIPVWLTHWELFDQMYIALRWFDSNTTGIENQFPALCTRVPISKLLSNGTNVTLPDSIGRLRCLSCRDDFGYGGSGVTALVAALTTIIPSTPRAVAQISWFPFSLIRQIGDLSRELPDGTTVLERLEKNAATAPVGDPLSDEDRECLILSFFSIFIPIFSLGVFILVVVPLSAFALFVLYQIVQETVKTLFIRFSDFIYTQSRLDMPATAQMFYRAT